MLRAVFLGVLCAAAAARPIVEDERMSENAAASQLSSASPVQISLYFEALCPDCSRFILQQLEPALALPEIDNIVSLKLLPYGNTRASGYTYTCQHGPEECRSDLLGLCLLSLLGGGDDAIRTGSSSREAFPYFACLERAGGRVKAAADCFGDTLARSPVSWAEVESCADDEERAATLQALGAAETPSEHEYVPWTVVDGDLFPDPNPASFLAFICEHYKGPLPDACWDKPGAVLAAEEKHACPRNVKL